MIRSHTGLYKSKFMATILMVVTSIIFPEASWATDIEPRWRGIHHQKYHTSCGFASLSTLLYALGDVEVNEVLLINLWMALRASREQSADISNGVRLDDLRDIARERGYFAALPKVRADTVRNLKRPVIVLLRRPQTPAHIVVLKGFSNGQAHLADPSIGHVVVDEATFMQEWATNNEGILLIVGDSKFKLTEGSPLALGASGIEELGVLEAMLRDAGQLRHGQRRTTINLSLENSTSKLAAETDSISTRSGTIGSAISTEYGLTDQITSWVHLPLERVRQRVRLSEGEDVGAIRSIISPTAGLDVRILPQTGVRPAVSLGVNVRPQVGGQSGAIGGHAEVTLTGRSWRYSADLALARNAVKTDEASQDDKYSARFVFGVRHQIHETWGVTAAIAREIVPSKFAGANDLVVSLGTDIRIGRSFFIRPTLSMSFGSVPTNFVGISFGWTVFD